MAEPTRELLRHIVATAAYRGAKAVRGAPVEFAAFRIGPTRWTDRSARPVALRGVLPQALQLRGRTIPLAQSPKDVG